MRTKIIDIASRLEKNQIDEIQARKEIYAMLNIKYKPKFVGRAKVNENSPLIYAGYELDIINLHSTMNDGLGVYPDGTREFDLSLDGTPFVKSHGWDSTIIDETQLEILWLKEI